MEQLRAVSEAPLEKEGKPARRRARWLPKGRIGRAAILLVATPLAVELLYIAGGNLALRWASQRVGRGSGIEVDYSKAYTLIPGHVHFTDLQLGGVADGAWRARMSAADIVVGFGDLVTLTSHLERVRMRDVVVDVGLPTESVASLVPARAAAPFRSLSAVDGASGSVPRSLLGSLLSLGRAPDRNVDGPSTSLLRIDELAASVTELTLGTRKLTGNIEVSASGVALRRLGTTVGHARLDVLGVALACGDDALARNLTGQIDARIDPDGRRSIVERTTARVEVNGELTSVAPLLSLTGLTSRGTHVGRLHIAGAIDHGVVAAGAELRAETTEAELRNAAGDTLSLPEGLVVLFGTDANRLHLTLKTPKIVLASTDPGKQDDALSGVVVDVDGGETDLAAPRLAARSLDWGVERAVVHEGALALSATLRGSMEVAAGPLDAAGIVAQSGEVEASNVVLERPASTEHAAFGVRILLSTGAISRDGGLVFGGRVKASGPDAGALLSLFGATPAIRLALGSIDKKPFTVVGTLRRSPGRLGLEDVRLESNGVFLDGAYYSRDDAQRAAFVVTYGRLPLGVSIVDGTDQVVFAPPSDWLAARTREAASLLAH